MIACGFRSVSGLAARRLLAVVLVLCIVATQLTPVYAATSGGEDNIQSSSVQDYGSDAPLQRGTVVKFNKKANRVLAVSKATMKDTYGVVVNRDDALVTFTGNAPDAPYQVFVATSGKFNVLVSNQNGEIKTNDYVSVSALDGIGMRADETQDTVIGKALEPFDGKEKSLGQTQLKDKSGKVVKTVNIGLIQIAVSIGRNPLAKNVKENLPSALEKAGNAIANKEVSAFRVYVSLVILAITAVISVTVLYVGIRSSVISIGRNPLMRKAIIKNMASIILISLTILIIGLFAVYLLLKL